MRSQVRNLLQTALLAVLIFIALQTSVQNYLVDGPSMQPTLHDGQFLVVSKFVYYRLHKARLVRFLPFLDAEAAVLVLTGAEEDLVAAHAGLLGESLSFEGQATADQMRGRHGLLFFNFRLGFDGFDLIVLVPVAGGGAEAEIQQVDGSGFAKGYDSQADGCWPDGWRE